MNALGFSTWCTIVTTQPLKWKGANAYSLMSHWDIPRVNVRNDPDLRNPDRANFGRGGRCYSAFTPDPVQGDRAGALYSDPPVNIMTDRHDWKHYLPATSLAGGNEAYECGKAD